MSQTQTIEGGNHTAIKISHFRPLMTLTMHQQREGTPAYPTYLVQMNKDQLAQLIDGLQRVHDELCKLPPIGHISDRDRLGLAEKLRNMAGVHISKALVDEVVPALLGETK